MMLANTGDDFLLKLAGLSAALLGYLPVSTLPDTLINWWNTGWDGCQTIVAPAAHFSPVEQLIVAVGGLYALDVGMVSWNGINYCVRRLSWFKIW